MAGRDRRAGGRALDPDVEIPPCPACGASSDHQMSRCGGGEHMYWFCLCRQQGRAAPDGWAYQLVEVDDAWLRQDRRRRQKLAVKEK